MNADGSNQVNLTNDPANDFSPTWSPDGTSIAFARNTGDYADIYVMNADGSGQTDITSSPLEYEAYPDWSPDGRGSRSRASTTPTTTSGPWTPTGPNQTNVTNDLNC